jgi:tetratricopeptide (TPR) repeat protein
MGCQVVLACALNHRVGEGVGEYRVQRLDGGREISALLLAFALRSREQVGYWRDSESVFTHALICTTGSFVAHDNLGLALAKRGE